MNYRIDPGYCTVYWKDVHIAPCTLSAHPVYIIGINDEVNQFKLPLNITVSRFVLLHTALFVWRISATTLAMHSALPISNFPPKKIKVNK